MNLSRREFLLLTGGSSCALLSGCATNPVTGRSQLMLISREAEIKLDKRWAPHQFSADYGPVRHRDVNDYVSEVGKKLAAKTHRPDMPYSFRVLNSVVVNGYTFPAGSVGLDRGLILAMENEAQLAAVLGHELAHVNHRHAASRQTKGLLAAGTMAIVTAYLEQEESEYTELTAGLGAIGASLLLARYSREHERQADRTGMEYIVKGGYPADGMAGLMEVFRDLHKTEPSVVELLFATHPLSRKRYETARERAQSRFGYTLERDKGRERYMDRIAPLRRESAAVKELQKGRAMLGKKKIREADSHFRNALAKAPEDYAGLLMMAKTLIKEEEYGSALNYCSRAREVYPSEPQALHVEGIALLNSESYERAYADFSEYERRLPGNINTVFYKGLSLEKMGRRKDAAGEYMKFCRSKGSGEKYHYALKRLKEWGYVREEKDGNGKNDQSGNTKK